MTAAVPISVDWHLWPRCNYACKFCFAQFTEIAAPMPKEDAFRVLPLLRSAGTEKITFVGGEPTLCPYLPDLIRQAKGLGMTTMLVTNASRLTRAYLTPLRGHLDWIAVSIESASEDIQAQLGRGLGVHVGTVREVVPLLRELGFYVKVNTVVTSLNKNGDLHELIRELAPRRWKVFQMLSVGGQNDDASQLAVSPSEFKLFVEYHRDLNPVAEDNDSMTGSYVMLDARGRFYQNTTGRHVYGRPILEVGVPQALADVGWNETKFRRRGGLYDWGRHKNEPRSPAGSTSDENVP